MRTFAFLNRSLLCICGSLSLAASSVVVAAEQGAEKRATAPPAAAKPDNNQAELDVAFVKMLSGATLEGSYNRTGPGSDMTKLSRDKYTLGEVKKLAGNLWLIPTRIQYGDRDVTIPITLPIEWAGDTPMVMIDKMDIPGLGVMSARVMFFDNHYAGYWKHGDRGGHLFGVITPADKAATPASGSDSSAGEKKDK